MKKTLLTTLFISIFFSFFNFANATSGACSSRLGVNCSAGEDWDGSVICNDGWRDSTTLYSNTVMCRHYTSKPTTHEELFANTIMVSLDVSLGYLRAQLAYEGELYKNASKYYTTLIKIASSEGMTQEDINSAILIEESSKLKIKKQKDEVIKLMKKVKDDITKNKNEYINGSYRVDKTFIKNIYNEAYPIFDSMINGLINDNSTNKSLSELTQTFLKTIDKYKISDKEIIEKSSNKNTHIVGGKYMCNNGYFYSNKKKECVLANKLCGIDYGNHAVLNKDTKKCVCEDGYYNSGGKCIKSIEYKADSTQKCEDGYYYSKKSYICVKSKENKSHNVFNDIDTSNKYSNAIVYLKKNNIIGGYSDGTFKPNNTINRAELLKILIGDRYNTSGYNNCFKDVNEEWFAPYVCYAKKQGWIKGYENGTFKPSQTVNRAEAIKMAIEVFGIELPKTIKSNPYSDVDKNLWFAPYIQISKESGLFDDSMTSYRAGEGMKRGDVSSIIYRLLAMKKLKMNKYSRGLDLEMGN